MLSRWVAKCGEKRTSSMKRAMGKSAGETVREVFAVLKVSGEVLMFF